MNDAEAFEFYNDPANLVPAGPAHRRKARPLTQHVPVRFPAATIEQVKQLAEADGMTVSAWIRNVVERSLRERGAAIAGNAETREVARRLQADVADLVASLERSA